MTKKLSIIPILLALFIVTMPLTLMSTNILSSGTTTTTAVSVVPPSIIDPTLVPNQTFTINVTILDVFNLYGLDIRFSWDPTILEYVEHTATIPVEDYPGGVLHEPVLEIKDEVDAVGGTYALVYSSMLPAEVFDGSGSAFEMTFKVKEFGSSSLSITSSDLSDIDGIPIAHDVIDGYFSNVPVEIHDIAVTDVIPFPTSVTVGDPVNINVTIENQGTEAETFDVSVFYDENLIEIQESIPLGAGDTVMLSFTWDTAGVTEGTYTISGEASIVPGEEDTEDNIFIDGEVTIVPVELFPPVAIFTYSPPKPVVNKTVTFDASESYDPDGMITSYEWDFGDTTIITETDPIAYHAYTEPGTYSVILTVTDNDGLTDTTQDTIVVIRPVPPVAPLAVSVDPEYSRAQYPEWKNFTVENLEMDNIIKVEITHPEGFKPTEYRKPYGWKVNYLTLDRQVIFESTDYSKYYIPPEGEGNFNILFHEGPTQECNYTFTVTVSDLGALAYTLQIDQSVDKTPPDVHIIYPMHEQKIIGEIWINATAHDVGKHISGIHHLELYVNNTYFGHMKYDPNSDVYWWYGISLCENGAWYVVEVKAFDNSFPGGNEASDIVSFLWWESTEVMIHPTSGYANVTVVEVTGVGYTHNSTVKVMFDDIIVGEVKTNGLGRFNTTFLVPEVPRNGYEVNAFDDDDNHDPKPPIFQVKPYITSLTPSSGTPPTEAMITGTGFKANISIDIVYRDVSMGKVYWEWAEEWNGTHTMKWCPHLDHLIVANANSNEKGSFTAEFHVPNSYGGLHPVCGRENDTGLRSDNALFFHVESRIWVDPLTGSSGQYIKIYGEGLPLPWDYSLVLCGETKYNERQWTLAIDFGPHKYWIWEENYILNNELNLAWIMSGWRPFAYYEILYMPSEPPYPQFPPENSPAWNGTLSWRGPDMKYRIGSPFLKVPVLEPDEYIIRIYQFDRKAQVDIFEYAASTEFMIKPLHLEVNLSEVIEKIDGLYLVIEDLEVKLDVIHARLVAVQDDIAVIQTDLGTIMVKLEDIHAKLVDVQGDLAVINSTLGQIIEKIDNLNLNITLTDIEERVATIQSDLGTIQIDVGNIKANITSIEGRVVTIKTSIGIIEQDIGHINGKIVSIEGNIATIETSIGDTKVSLDDINIRITVTKDNIATIKTDVGTISGKLTSIEGDVATIETDMGTIKTNTDNIKGATGSIEGNTSLQPAILVLCIINTIAIGLLGVSVWKKRTK